MNSPSTRTPKHDTSTRDPAAFVEQAAAAPCPTEREIDSDTHLITQFLAGKESAFDTLLLRHQQRAFSIAYGLLGSHEDAAEVTQDAFVKIYHALATFRRDASFTTWLYRIVTNLAHNKNRHALVRGKGRIISFDCDEAQALPLADPAPTAAEQALAHESHEQLLAALDKLNAEHREVIVLYSMREMSYEEIAGVLEISVGTVKSRLFRAREELTKILKTQP